MKYGLFVIFTIIFFVKCATSTAGLATSNIPIVNKNYKVIGSVEGKMGWWTFDIGIIGIPLKKPPMVELVKQLIKQKNADALVNIRYWNDKTIILFMTYNQIGINADAVRFE